MRLRANIPPSFPSRTPVSTAARVALAAVQAIGRPMAGAVPRGRPRPVRRMGSCRRERLVQEANGTTLAFPLPGLNHDPIDADIVQPIAQIDEMALGQFHIDLDLLVLDM
jgi:hypothetical protein